MTSQGLLFLIIDDHSESVRYAVAINGHITESASATLDALAADAQFINCNVCVFIPGEHVLSIRVERPRGSSGVLKRMLPFMIEDRLAKPITSFHVVHRASGKAFIECLAIEQEVLQRYIALFEKHGIRPAYLLPDFVLIQRSAKTTALKDGSRLLVRYEDGTGLSLSTFDDRLLQQMETTQPEADLQFRVDYAPDNEINLLAGNYAVNAPEGLGARAIPWLKFSTGMATLIATCLFANTLWFDHASSQTRSELAHQLPGPNSSASTFSELQSAIEARKREAARIHDTTRLFRSLRAFADALSLEAPGSTTVRQIRFESKHSTLSIELGVADLAALNGITERIAEAGFKSRVLSTQLGDSGPIARLEIAE